MKTFFKDKFEYNFKSNQSIIALIQDNPHAYTERVQRLFCHTLNAQNIWTNRILMQPYTQEVWDVFELELLHQLNADNHNLSLGMLEQVQLNTILEYSNTQGDTFANKVEDIIYHMINHGTYHRGQIITDLKASGVTPISTDFIFYKR